MESHRRSCCRRRFDGREMGSVEDFVQAVGALGRGGDLNSLFVGTRLGRHKAEALAGLSRITDHSLATAGSPKRRWYTVAGYAERLVTCVCSARTSPCHEKNATSGCSFGKLGTVSRAAASGSNLTCASAAQSARCPSDVTPTSRALSP
jgi:hypothetical protein